MRASEAKKLTGAKTAKDAVRILYEKLSAQENWHLGDRPFSIAGYDSRKDLVHFTATWSVPGGAGHRRLGMPLLDDANSSNGDFKNAPILH